MIKFKIDDGKLRVRLEKIEDKATDPKRLLRRIWRDQHTQSGLMFRRLAGGGTYRGVTWPFFAPQYTRETDGETVPAWGGVPRLDGRGDVLGRLRGSGTRVTESSNLLRDTGLLASAAASVHRFIRRGQGIEITTPLKYARPQNDKRPFMFFTRADRKKYRGWALKELMGK